MCNKKSIDRWKLLIDNTEKLINEWNCLPDLNPYYRNICKHWENFLDRQKQDLEYFLKLNLDI